MVATTRVIGMFQAAGMRPRWDIPASVRLDKDNGRRGSLRMSVACDVSTIHIGFARNTATAAVRS